MATTGGCLDDAKPQNNAAFITNDTTVNAIDTMTQQDATHGHECGSSDAPQAKESGDEEVAVPNDGDVKEINDNIYINNQDNHHYDNNIIHDNNSSNNHRDNHVVCDNKSSNIDPANNVVNDHHSIAENNNTGSNNSNGVTGTTSNNNNGDNTTRDDNTINANNPDVAPAPPAPASPRTKDTNVVFEPVAGSEDGRDEDAREKEEEAAPVTTSSLYRPPATDTGANQYAVWADTDGYSFATLLTVQLQYQLEKQTCNRGVVGARAKDALRRAGIPEHVIDGTPIRTVTSEEASALLPAQAPEEEADDATVVVEDIVQASVEVVDDLIVDVGEDTAAVVVGDD